MVVSKGPTTFFCNTATLSTLKPSGIQGSGWATLCPGRFFLALEVGRENSRPTYKASEKRPGDEVGEWCNPWKVFLNQLPRQDITYPHLASERNTRAKKKTEWLKNLMQSAKQLREMTKFKVLWRTWTQYNFLFLIRTWTSSPTNSKRSYLGYLMQI